MAALLKMRMTARVLIPIFQTLFNICRGTTPIFRYQFVALCKSGVVKEISLITNFWLILAVCGSENHQAPADSGMPSYPLIEKLY